MPTEKFDVDAMAGPGKLQWAGGPITPTDSVSTLCVGAHPAIAAEVPQWPSILAYPLKEFPLLQEWAITARLKIKHGQLLLLEPCKGVVFH
ncbi:hypothetical protein [Undibacterium terreum]|uniref:hypothetical protein n=1 Tax=Undibacterium terreum TaxID=1224302 RepID=UPI0016643176|nr:hypothetical protein [Undibacterium terreum]